MRGKATRSGADKAVGQVRQADQPLPGPSVTAQEQTETLERELEMLRVVTEHTDVGIAYLDSQFNFLWANSYYARYCGRSKEELTGRNYFDLFPNGENRAIFERAKETGEPVEARSRPLHFADQPERGVTYWDWTLSPVKDEAGQVQGLVLSTLEVTERVRAEYAQRFLDQATQILTSSLDYEATLQTVARLAVPHLADWCVVDIVEAEGSFRRLVVFHRDPSKEALARELQERYPPDPAWQYGVARVVRTGEAELDPEVPESLLIARARDAEHLRLLRELGFNSLLIAPLRARGRTLGAISLVLAQPGRRFGPGDLAFAEALGSRAAVAIDNAWLHRQAQEALKARQDFLAGISHDLKNPLTVIRGWAKILKRRTAQDPAREHEARALADVDKAAETMERMIDQLLDAARLEAGEELHLKLQEVDLWQLTTRLVEEYRTRAEHHEITLQGEGPGVVLGRWDADRLERVVSNLLSNAIKFSPAGGPVSVEVLREDAPPGPHAVLIVRDQGVGIPAADLPYIFQRFHRAGNVVGRIGGTGVGLATSRQIIEQHRGTISVESKEGSGSTFTVKLPLR